MSTVPRHRAGKIAALLTVVFDGLKFHIKRPSCRSNSISSSTVTLVSVLIWAGADIGPRQPACQAAESLKNSLSCCSCAESNDR